MARPALPDSSAWVVLASSILITFTQPNASDSRYVIPSYLLMVGFGAGLFALFPLIRAIDVAFSAGVACVAIGGMIRSEANMLFGVQESIELLRNDRYYNTGIDGSAISYGDSFAWLRGTGCTRILAQTAGGLGPQGMPGEGILTTYQYGLWGDNLCNDVAFVAVSDLSVDALSSPEVLATITGTDFLVVHERSLGNWQAVLEDHGVSSLVVDAFPANEYFSVGQIVLELQAAATK